MLRNASLSLAINRVRPGLLDNGGETAGRTATSHVGREVRDVVCQKQRQGAGFGADLYRGLERK